MSSDLERAKAILQQTGSTCVLCRDQLLLTTQERGIRPLVRWLQEEEDTWACAAADKVVGKAAALLYCLLGVRCVHGNVMSSAAVKLLRNNGVEVSWDRLTEFIRNPAGTDLCPLEQAVAHVDDPDDALPVILQAFAAFH